MMAGSENISSSDAAHESAGGLRLLLRHIHIPRLPQHYRHLRQHDHLRGRGCSQLAVQNHTPRLSGRPAFRSSGSQQTEHACSSGLHHTGAFSPDQRGTYKVFGTSRGEQGVFVTDTDRITPRKPGDASHRLAWPGCARRLRVFVGCTS
jgi:hypothetical protein